MTDRIAARALRLCLRAYPRERRERDGEVLLSLAHELCGGGSTSWREAAGLLRGGVTERARIRWRGLVRAPWRAALATLALPLAAVHLAVWVAGIARLYDPLPLGKWWTLVLGGSLLAVIGAALRRRAVATAGSLGVLVALAHYGLSTYIDGAGAQPAHFSSELAGIPFELDSAMLPAALVLFLASLALPRRPVAPVRGLLTLLGAALPAIGLLLLALSRRSGTADPGGELTAADPGGALTAALLVLAALTAVWCAFRRRREPVMGPFGAIVLAVAAPAGAWILPSLLPYGGAWDTVGMTVFVAGWVISPLAVLALVGRDTAATAST